jgi:hypothetical protein
MDVVASTIAKYGKTVEDNLPRLSPLIKWLQKNGRMSERGSGDGFSGLYFRQPLKYGLNTNVVWYFNKEVVPLEETEHLAYADYYVRQFGGSFVVSGLDEIINDGREAIINMMASKLENLEESMQYMLAESAHYDGTEHGGKAFGGIRLAVPDNAAVGRLGGIDRAAAVDQRGRKWWQSQALSTASVPAPAAGAAQVRPMTRAYNRLGLDVNDGPNKVDLSLADKVHYLDYLEEFQEKQMFTDTKRGGAGFQNLMHMGLDVPVVNDYMMPVTKHTYVLNTEHVYLRKAKRWMKTLGKERPANQDISATTIVGAGNFCFSNLARQGVVYTP